MRLRDHALRNPPVHTTPDEVIQTDVYVPQVGDRHEITAPSMYPFDAVVTSVNGSKAAVARADPGGEPSAYGVTMPAASVAHFVNDLRGHVYSQYASGYPVIDAVTQGDAEFLGKGDDGLVFLIDTSEGEVVVKVSTTVPFQPFNPNHLTPREAANRLSEQQATSESMRADGVPGILPSTFVMHGDKGFMVKPYVEIPDHLTRAQLDEVAASVEAAHKAGWAFHDSLQVGLWKGHVYHFDTGKVEQVGVGKRTDPDDWHSDAYNDVESLKRLFSDNDERYLTKTEQQNPIKEFEALYGLDVRSLDREQRSKYRGLVLRLAHKIKLFLRNHPGEDHGFWSEIPEYADDEKREMMNRLKEPT
jgi:hypothetical protein